MMSGTWGVADSISEQREKIYEKNINSPHFLFVKYESAAGSLKCLLNIVSAPAWKSYEKTNAGETKKKWGAQK